MPLLPRGPDPGGAVLPAESNHRIRGGPPRASRRAFWRAASLIVVHAAILAHLAHWKVSERTLTPLEPSEAMQTLELGYVNAGFVLFGLALLATTAFGRFFCGWACHVVAYQDLCAWILKKLRIRPRPIRSRLLALVPGLAAVYMFLWPQLARLLEDREFPALVRHFSTDDFWATFPGPWIALLTFVIDGFLIVYLLGAKGFCTYGCPYGALFGVADRIAPWKIRVTDACEGCGHCTATCTSNVRVHEEVARFGAVVDERCMKCMDCVNVCPKDALYLGFGRPRLGRKTRAGKRVTPRREYDFVWGEELAMAVVFGATFYAFRGLYGVVPLLLSIGLGVIAAVLFICVVRLVARSDQQFQHLALKRGGKWTRAGLVAAATIVSFLGLTAHSAAVQYHAREGLRLINRAEQLPRAARGEEIAKSLEHLRTSERLGLVPRADHHFMMGSILREQGDATGAELLIRRAIELDPEKMLAARIVLADLLARRGARAEGVDLLREVLALDPENENALRRLRAADALEGEE